MNETLDPSVPDSSPNSLRLSVGYPHLLPCLPEGYLPTLYHLDQMLPLQLLLLHEYVFGFHGDILTLQLMGT